METRRLLVTRRGSCSGWRGIAGKGCSPDSGSVSKDRDPSQVDHWGRGVAPTFGTARSFTDLSPHTEQLAYAFLVSDLASVKRVKLCM